MKLPEELIDHLEHEINIGNVDKKVQNLILLIFEENKKNKEVIDKAISHLDLFISDTGLSKYDTLKILMHTKKILKEVE